MRTYIYSIMVSIFSSACLCFGMQTQAFYLLPLTLNPSACFGFGMQTQEVFRTDIFREDIKSLEIKVEDEMISTPFIELHGEKKIEISFDALFRTDERFSYSVIHCDAEWKKSTILPIEYMKGFQRTPIDDYAIAISTTTHYTNYRFFLPNENTQLTLSGNYAIQVYSEDRPGKVVFTACFSIVEPLVEINAGVTGNTIIDFNKEHQQVEFDVNMKKINISYPQNELKIFVYQNNNIDDRRTVSQPSMFSAKQLQYHRLRELVFEAGNEYRRIEFLTHRTTSLGIEDITFFNPYYHITLYQDQKRTNQTYSYDQDQNGRFFVRCRGCNDHNSESDYYVVHFSLASELLRNGKVFLYGDFFNNSLDARCQMDYNEESGAYEKAILLKTGLYNFQYVFQEDGGTKPTFKKTEGSFFEAENEYNILVYYRPIGARYDRLIGYKNLSSRRR